VFATQLSRKVKREQLKKYNWLCQLNTITVDRSFYFKTRKQKIFYTVSCLLGCRPELSNDNNKPSTRYALLH